MASYHQHHYTQLTATTSSWFEAETSNHSLPKFNLCRKWLSTIYEVENEDDSDHEQLNGERYENICSLTSPSSWYQKKRSKEIRSQPDRAKPFVGEVSPAFNILHKTHLNFLSPRRSFKSIDLNSNHAKSLCALEVEASSATQSLARIAKAFLRPFACCRSQPSKPRLEIPIQRRCQISNNLTPPSSGINYSSRGRQRSLKIRECIATQRSSRSFKRARSVNNRGPSPSICPCRAATPPLSYSNSTSIGSFSPSSPFSRIVKAYSLDRRGRCVRHPFLSFQAHLEERRPSSQGTSRRLSEQSPCDVRDRHSHWSNVWCCCIGIPSSSIAARQLSYPKSWNVFKDVVAIVVVTVVICLVIARFFPP